MTRYSMEIRYKALACPSGKRDNKFLTHSKAMQDCIACQHQAKSSANFKPAVTSTCHKLEFGILVISAYLLYI
jgi:hypothetical protein